MRFVFPVLIIYNLIFGLPVFNDINIANAQNANIQTPPSAEDFAIPDDRSFSISNDGKKVAFLSGDEKDSKLVLIDLEKGEEIPINLGDKTKPRVVSWADNDHLLITVSFSYNADKGSKNNYYKYELYRTGSYSLSKKAFKIIMPNPDLENNTSLNIIYTDTKNNRVLLTGLITDYDADYYNFNKLDKLPTIVSLFYADLDTGLGKEIKKGNINTHGFFLDKNGTPRLRLDIDVKKRKTKLYKFEGKKEIEFIEVEDSIGLPFSIQGFLDDNSILILEDENKITKAKKLNIETGEKTDFFSSESRNISNIINDPFTNEPMGIEFEGYEPSIKWLDERLEKHQALLNKTFKEKQVSIVDWDAGLENLLISVVSGNHKKITYLFNTKTKQAGELSIIPEAFSNYKFGEKKLEKFKASDGLEIPVFVTRPPNSSGKKMPAILLPHGGPKAQDDAEFDYMSQFLASRGYIVIQPQFRGSTGNGAEFISAGYGQWAGKMQSDTIEALDYVINKGEIDKDRVCIVGASYGGYSAMVGIAQSASKFKCAISYGGLFDLAADQIDSENRSDGTSTVVDFWREHMGFTRFQTKEIRAISPKYMIDKINSPVLLMHGEDDTVVLPLQSREMFSVMKKAGKNVKYVELKGEDHWLSKQSTRAQFLKEMEIFLAPILKPEQ